MKILLLHNRYQQAGGEDRCVDAHRQLLEAHGHEVRLIQASNSEIDSGVETAKAAVGWLYSRKWKAIVAAGVSSFRPDIAHLHNIFPLLSPSVIYACKDAGVPVVQTLHNYRLLCPGGTLFRSGKVCEACCEAVFPWRGVIHKCYRGSAVGTGFVGTGSTIHRLLGTYARHVNWFVALTEFAKRKFVNARLPEQKFVIVPNWLAGDPGPGDGRGGFFLFVGRLSPEKGVLTLLSAWSSVHSQATLKIVGTGPLEANVVEATKHGTGMEYLGYQPPAGVLKLMQQATAVIIPSQCYEGLPLALVESFAAGTPVIAPRFGSFEELVKDQHTGLLFPHDNPSALANRIEWMVANPLRLPAMRAAARTEYESRYTAERSYHLLLDLYTRTLGARAIGSRKSETRIPLNRPSTMLGSIESEE